MHSTHGIGVSLPPQECQGHGSITTQTGAPIWFWPCQVALVLFLMVMVLLMDAKSLGTPPAPRLPKMVMSRPSWSLNIGGYC